jgi:MFS family permease
MSQKGHVNDLRIQAFVALLLADFFLTADYSVFPAAVLQVTEEMHLTNVQMGLLGTLVYAGLTISSVISPFFIDFGRIALGGTLLGALWLGSSRSGVCFRPKLVFPRGSALRCRTRARADVRVFPSVGERSRR